MSQIKLLHSGGNGVSIVAPDSNPASDRTLKLPSDGDGTILTTNSSVGKILQVISNVKSDNASWTGTSFVDIAGTDEAGNGSIWEVNITPTAANSKILFEFSGAMGSNLGVMMALRLVREINDSSAAYPFLGDSGGVRPQVSRHVRDDQTDMKVHAIHQSHFTFLDSPSYSVGDTLTYKIQVASKYSSREICINRTSNGSDQTYTLCGTSTITLEEVAA